MRMIILRIVALGLVVAVADATAQTRTAEIEAEREKKMLALQPERVSDFENLLLQIKQLKVLERLASCCGGFRAQIGGMATGSGFAGGVDFYREDLLHGQLQVHAAGAVSTRMWQKYEFGLTAPRLADNHLSLQLEAGRRRYRSLEFYGAGPDSELGNRTNYLMDDTDVKVQAAFSLLPYARIGGSLGGVWVSTGPGKREDLASTDTVFDDASLPGFGSSAKYLRSSVFGQIDYRDNPSGPKSGGNYVAAYTWYDDVSPGAFDFRRLDIDAQQYIPFFNKSRRIALRIRATMTEAGTGQLVPFYLQPFMGGSDDLRGFRPYRFTGQNAIVYNAEYRWEIFSGLDGALFFDAGKVMPDAWDWNMSDLETSPGFGLRFNARNRTFIRLDVAISNEGVGVWFKFNDPFLPQLLGVGIRQPRY